MPVVGPPGLLRPPGGRSSRLKIAVSGRCPTALVRMFGDGEVPRRRHGHGVRQAACAPGMDGVSAAHLATARTLPRRRCGSADVSAAPPPPVAVGSRVVPRLHESSSLDCPSLPAAQDVCCQTATELMPHAAPKHCRVGACVGKILWEQSAGHLDRMRVDILQVRQGCYHSR